jgi:hypothetical protein
MPVVFTLSAFFRAQSLALVVVLSLILYNFAVTEILSDSFFFFPLFYYRYGCSLVCFKVYLVLIG